MLITSPGIVRRRRRSPDMSTVRIPLRSRKYPGMSAVIDEADAPLVREHDWHVLRDHNTWYAYRYIRREDGRLSRQAMHRLIMSPPEDMVVDHIDHDGLNNRRKNLRVCTHQQNSQNMKVDCPNRGIHFSKPTEVYRVFVERVHCGNYKDLVTAQLVRDCVARDMWG